jgi:hypothetical protein
LFAYFSLECFGKLGFWQLFAADNELQETPLEVFPSCQMLDKLHQERPCRLAGLCGQALAHKSVSGFNAPVRAPCCVAVVRVSFSFAAYDSAGTADWYLLATGWYLLATGWGASVPRAFRRCGRTR